MRKMSFGKFMSAYMITFFLQFMYSQFAFFQYPHPIYDGFAWPAFGKLLVETALFSGLLFGFYSLIDKFPAWRMRVRYEKAQKERLGD